MTSDTCTIGVDLGGTKVTSGLVSADGKILGRDRRLLPDKAQESAVRAEIEGSIAAMLSAAREGKLAVRALGIGIPAVADGKAGRAASNCCPNLPLLEHCDLGGHLRQKFALPVGVANDANCFVLGEHWAGEGRGAHDLVGLTLGTGVGCGVILDGRLRAGGRGCCGEIWDAPIPGGGILEDWLSGAGVVQLAGRPDTELAAAAARLGDAQATAAWASFGAYLGLALAWIERVLDPELFVLGGSLTKAWDLFSPALRDQKPGRPVVRSSLGEDAAVVGAARLAAQDEMNGVS